MEKNWKAAFSLSLISKQSKPTSSPKSWTKLSRAGRRAEGYRICLQTLQTRPFAARTMACLAPFSCRLRQKSSLDGCPRLQCSRRRTARSAAEHPYCDSL
eukprot:6499448-Lingulodinium_polyedra.AAC.1